MSHLEHQDLIAKLAPLGFRPIGAMRFSDGVREIDVAAIPLEDRQALAEFLRGLRAEAHSQ